MRKRAGVQRKAREAGRLRYPCAMESNNLRSGLRFSTFLGRAMRGEAALWQVWWIAGIPVIALATWLGVTAEDFRYDEEHFWGAALDTAKFLLCLAWLVTAWRCSHNVRVRTWRHVGRLAIGMAVIFVGLIY